MAISDVYTLAFAAYTMKPKRLINELGYLHMHYLSCIFRSSHRRCSVKKGVLFAKFAGKHMYQSLFFNKVAGLRTPFLHITSRRLLLDICNICNIDKSRAQMQTFQIGVRDLKFRNKCKIKSVTQSSFVSGNL